jgi:hypothetical protein
MRPTLLSIDVSVCCHGRACRGLSFSTSIIMPVVVVALIGLITLVAVVVLLGCVILLSEYLSALGGGGRGGDGGGEHTRKRACEDIFVL